MSWAIRVWRVPNVGDVTLPQWEWSADDQAIYLGYRHFPVETSFRGRANNVETAKKAAEAAVDRELARRDASEAYYYPKETE